jgi:hypothetical protein
LREEYNYRLQVGRTNPNFSNDFKQGDHAVRTKSDGGASRPFLRGVIPKAWFSAKRKNSSALVTLVTDEAGEPHAPDHQENGEMVRMMLEAALARFQPHE